MAATATEAKEAGGKAWSDGKFLEAVEHFSKAISLSNRETDAELLKVLYSNRSASYLKMGRSSEALADADKCLEIDATWSKGLTRKGDALMLLSRYPEALEVFESMARQTPADASVKTKLTQVRAAMHAQANPFSTPVPMHKLAGKPYNFVDRYSTIQTYMRMAIVACGVGYMIPWRVVSAPCHTFFLLFAVISYVMALYRSYGMPRFTKEYAQLVLPDGTTQLLFLALMQFSVHSYYLAMMPILLGEIGHLVPFYMAKMVTDQPALVDQIMDKVNQYIPPALGISVEQWVAMPDKSKWEIFYTIINQLSSTAEVMQMIFLLMELFMPSRNFLFIFLWYQYLQMRYLQDRNGCLKAAFKNLDSQVLSLLAYSFVPSIVRTGYYKFKALLLKAVVPVPGQTRPSMLPSMPKSCTIS